MGIKENPFIDEDTFNYVPPSFSSEVFRILRSFTLGAIEGEQGRVSAFRYSLRGKRLFKLVARYLVWRWPHSKQQLQGHISAPADAHLQKVIDYTIRRSTYRPVHGANRRAEIYYKMISFPPRDLSTEKLLIIGGKDVAELFMAWLYGFSWKNIQGIDLFSLHPKIHVMNMEDMSFGEESFDAVTMSNVYGYQLDPVKCLAEVARVLRPNGHFVFNQNFNPTCEIPSGAISGDAMLKIFGRLGFSVAAHSEVPRGDTVTHLWHVQKSLRPLCQVQS